MRPTRGSAAILALTLATVSAVALSAPVESTKSADPAPSSAPPRVYDSWLEGRPGYYPPSDPESLSVITGRRESKLVDLPFAGGRDSLAGLGRAVLAALASQRADSLAALCISRREFEQILWLDFPESRPVTGLTAMDGWRPLSMRLSSGIAGALSEYGGAPLAYESVTVASGVKEYQNFRLHRGIVIAARDTTGAPVEVRFVRSIAEREGRFKIYSTDD